MKERREERTRRSSSCPERICVQKKKRDPLVSVILPVYNGGSFLAESIESILSQTYPNVELIIIDDGSRDQTGSIIRSYAKQHEQAIRPIFLKRNCGDGTAANIGLRHARGSYIARMDADDIAHPRRLEQQVTFLQKHKHVIVVGSQADVIDRTGKKIGTKTFPQSHTSIYKLYGIIHPMLHPSVMFRRSSLPNPKRIWRNSFRPNGDYLTFFELLQYGQFANLPLYLLSYRIHGRNISLRAPRKTLLNMVKIRWIAWRTCRYRPTWWAIFFNLIQLCLVLALPEKMVLSFYLRARGMRRHIPTPRFFIPRLLFRFAK